MHGMSSVGDLYLRYSRIWASVYGDGVPRRVINRNHFRRRPAKAKACRRKRKADAGEHSMYV